MEESLVVSELTSNFLGQITLGTERVKNVLTYLNNPQDSYKVIHITGTNGKGSTAAFIEVGLRQAGFKVGKYTSPYIDTLYETITVNAVAISQNQLIEIFSLVDKIRRKYSIMLSPFELLTVIMFEYCARQMVDYLVLEVGMGGLNDATNVISNPVYSVITNISLEHTMWFGNTLAAIAREKCGIIKNNGSVVIADSCQQLYEEVRKKTENCTNVLDKYNYTVALDWNKFTTVIELADNEQYTLNLFGKFQANNFLCAYEVLQGLGVVKRDICLAASSCVLRGRLQLVSHEPQIIVDVTHNSGGAKVLYETLKEGYCPDEVVIITSILKDKNIPKMLGYFCGFANAVIFTAIHSSDRGMSARELLAISSSAVTGCQLLQAVESLPEALTLAKSLKRKLIVITGSFYLLHDYFALEQLMF